MDVLEKELGLRIAPDYTKLLIPQNVNVPKPESVFTIGGIPVATKGSLSVIKAKIKSGKTTVVAWIVAQMLKLGLIVIWCDTEQGLYYGSRTQHWILSIAFLENCENLKYFDLRSLNSEERLAAIDQILHTYACDVLVIDGARDLIRDYNNPEQSVEISGQIMKWSESFNCHIMNILHQNKADANSRGHYGAEMEAKSETVFNVETNNDKQIVVSRSAGRGPDFETFALMRSEKGIPYLLEDFSDKGVAKNTKPKNKLPEIIDSSLHLLALNKTFKEELTMNATNFYGEFVVAYNCFVGDPENDKMSGNRARGFLKYYVDYGFLTLEKGERNNEKLYAPNANKVSDDTHD